MIRSLLALAIVFLFAMPLITRAQIPVANFSASKTAGCSPVIVQFTDLSTGNPTSWNWDLGNGGSSTLQNPAASYIAPGTYTVILTATNSSGSTRDTNYITVYTSPTVAFTSDTVSTCGTKTVQFTNQTVPGAGGTTSYLWDFGDGDSSTTVNPLHIYSYPGNFTVSLIVINSSGCTGSLTKNNYINVLPKPVAGFTANNTTSCNAPFQVIFTNSSSNGVSYSWDFGDGNNSTSSGPTHTYTGSGTYTVRLIAIGANGCSDTLSRTSYIVIGQVNANFTVGPACQGAATQFTNTTTPAPGVGHLWDAGYAGLTDTALNPVFTYSASGTYTVKLIEMYGNNCNDTITKSITVTAAPVVSFATPDTVGCTVPFIANFTNNTTGAATYSWSFGAGSSSATTPSFQYNSLGKYTVALTATNAGGCVSVLTKTDYIKILPPTGTLLASTNGACANESIVFVGVLDTPLYATNYRWDFGDGSGIVNCAACNSQAHAYAGTGTYNVQLIITTATGCYDTSTVSVVVSSKPTAGFTGTPLAVCPHGTVTFTNSSAGATTYAWNFGDGGVSAATSPAYPYSTAGTYDVTLVASNAGCKDTLKRTSYVLVYPPHAKFTPSFQCNSRLFYTFLDSSSGADTYYWDFGDGNSSTTSGTVTHTYSTAGTYNVILRVTNTASGCVDTLVHTINATPIVLPTFTVNDSTLCKNEIFTITRSAATGLTFQWYYDMDYYPTQALQPQFQCFHIGTYAVKMVVTDSAGCKDSTVKSNYIKVGGPVVDFTTASLNPCKLTPVLFTDASTVGGFPIVNRYWDFGDHTQSSTALDTVYHVFNNTGPYTIKLTATDANGCVDSATKTNYVYINKPTAQFYSYDTVICAGDTVQFQNNSGGNNFTSYWLFGDGGSSTNITPQHSYAAVGNYTVKLIVTDTFGCVDSTSKTDYIKVQKPTASFTMSDSVIACPPLTVYLNNTSTSSNSYLWTFGNNNQSSNTSPSTTYTYPGVYSIKLVATNVAGCKDSTSKTVTVNGPTGSYSYTPLSGCNPLTVQFTAVSSNTNTYIWDMNNGVTQNTSTGSFSYTYTTAGKYVPKLILSDGASCQVPFQNTDTVTVDEIDMDFNYTTAGNLCNNDTVFFNDTTELSISAVTSRSWTFGDGGTSTSADPSHFYSTPGTYVVRLIATNASGCSDTVTKNVTVRGLPSISISASADSICPGQPTGVQLTATGGVSYSWTPVAGLSCSNCANPDANPLVHTVYVVTGTDTNGCMNTDTVTVGIKPKPVISASNDTSICAGAFAPLTVSGAATYVWTPATGLSCTNCANPSASPATTNAYTVIGTNSSGCTDTSMVTVTVLTRPTVSAGSNKTICSLDSAKLVATGAVTYAWLPTTALSCINCDTTYANPSTTTVYSAIGTAANGCKDTATVTVNVNALPTVGAGADRSICMGATTALQATGAVTYTWTPATALSCTNCANPNANPVSTISYIVTGTDANTCKGKDTVVVTVNPLPTVGAGADQFVCIGYGVPLQATGAASYVWTPSTGLSCTNCANPVATPNTTTTYIVTGTDGNTCTDTGATTVTVNPQPTVGGGAAGNICPGDSAQLQATGALSYIWSPTTGLSSTTISNPKASPGATATYTVIGTDGNGCKDTATVDVNVNTPPTVNAGSNVAICAGASTALQATGAATYIWSPAAGLSCTNCANPNADPATTTTYTVIGANGNSCKDTATVTVTVNPLPTVNANANQSVCIGYSVTLQATGATSYTWTPATGLSCTNCANPTATPNITTTYTVTGMDGNTCTDTGVTTVTVNPQPVVNGGAAGNICPGDSAQLQATGAVSYIWSPAAGLSSTTISNPKSSPVATTTYTVIGTDANGCKDTATADVNVNTKPVVSAGSNVAICNGGSTGLNATGAAAYAWSPSTGLSCTSCANPTANPVTTTTYTVIGTNGSSCKDTATVTVTVNSLPNVNAGGDNTICIGFSAALTATGATSYVWTPTTGLTNPNIANPVATPNVTTAYIVTGTDGNTCTNKDTVIVNVNPQPVIGAGTNQNICPGDSAQLQGTGAVTYVWSPATGLSNTTISNPKASPAITTPYTLIGTDGNGCKDTATVTVNVNAKPVVSAGSNVAICTGSSTALQATGAASYTWSPATGLSCTNCANPTANPTSTTTYTVIGTNGTSCKDTATVTVTVNPLPNVGAGINPTICVGFSTTLQATGAATYTWSPTTGLSNPAIANPVASPAVTTTYTVTGTDGNGCINTATVKVNVNAKPVISGGGNKTICNNDSAQLQGSGAVTYVWSPATGLNNTTISNPKAAPSVTTVYRVIGTDANGCKDTTTVTVNVNALPNINAGANQVICNGSNIQLNASGGVSYVWTPTTGLSNPNIGNPVASPTTTTVYTVTGTDGNGCKNTSTVTVTVNPLPNVSGGSNQSICLKDTAQLQATGAVTYSWSPVTGLTNTAISNPKASPAVTTVYTVTGTDANGCVNTSTVTVTIKTLPAVNAGNDVTICNGDTTQLQATGASTYTWTPALALSCTNCSNPKANPIITTPYIVTGTAANTCIASDTVLITVNPLPVIGAGANTSICKGDSLQLQGSGGVSYTWKPVAWLSCINCPDPKAGPDTTITYTVTGTDINGCKNNAHITVTVKPLPDVTASAARGIICEGDTTQLLAKGGTSYSWTPAINLSCIPCNNPIATPTVSTTYTVTGTTNGCSDTALVTVNINPKPNVSAGPDLAFCTGSSDTLRANGAVTYTWSPATGLSCTNCALPVASPAGSTTYTVTGVDANGCKNKDDAKVTVYNLPPVDAGEDKTFCEGDSVQLNATGALTFIWSPATGLSCINCNNPKAKTALAATYTVTGTDGNGCANADSVTVTAILKGAVSYSQGDSICVGQQTTLTAQGGTSYAWYPAEGLSNPQSASTVAAPVATTKYRIIIKQGNCFSDTGYVTVGVFGLPTVSAGPDQTVGGGTEVKVETKSKDAVQFEWTPSANLSCSDCANPVITATRTTTYHVKVTSLYGCTAEDDMTLYVTCGTDQIFVANTFTPNADGVNDMFFPQGKGLSHVQRFSIYSRWGELIFDRQNMPVNDAAYGWDGTYKQEQLKPDVFVYIIRAFCENGEPIEIKGDISLIR